MKNFNLSAIMTRAWAIAREMGYTMSVALRLAWFEAKNEVKKAYIFHLTDERLACIMEYLRFLTNLLKTGEADIHDVHKYHILYAAIESVSNGIIVADGKTVGLLKYAVRQAA